MADKVHAPKTGVSHSDGKTPPAVSPGITAHPKHSDGKASGGGRSGDSKSSVISK